MFYLADAVSSGVAGPMVMSSGLVVSAFALINVVNRHWVRILDLYLDG